MASATPTYKLTLQGGEEREVRARTMKYTEYGVEFSGAPNSQGREVVAFVPYGSLLLLEVVK